MREEKNSEVVKKEKKQKVCLSKIKDSFKSRRFKNGAYSSILTILVFAIIIVVNLVFSKLDLSTDLSSGGLFTLTKESKKVIKEVDQDLTIYYMVEEGSEEDYIYNVLKQYDKASKHIDLKKVDPVVNPSFASNHGIDNEVVSNDVIVESNKTKTAKYISCEDMYYSSQSYSSDDAAAYLDAEGQVTSAIQSIMSATKTKMYVMTKHSEQELGNTLTSTLDKMDIETEDLELATLQAVPDDCDILLINGPSVDLTEEEKNMVLDYLKSGGYAMINVMYTEEKMPNFEEILDYYGVQVNKGVVFEENYNNYITYPNCILPSVNSEYTPLSDVNGYVVFPNAVGLSAAGEDALRSSVTITDIMDTSDSAYAKVDMTSDDILKEDGDIDGPFSVGMAITESLQDGKETRLVVYSAASAFTEQFTATSQLKNADVFSKSMSSLVDSEVEKVSVEAKSLSYSYLSVEPGTQIFWAVIIIIIIPFGLLLTGFGIWFVRRRK
ncbi:MAG: Gldg family protein [Butyribacter sp.]|nr:Gldg family protein [bacterium]MDY3853342.1 Gldg family protein [Butyribacter sp.]